MEKELDWKKYEEIAVQTVAEGIVMLKNDNETLPLCKDDVVSLFGRIMFHYYKSGTGSGGMVNVTKVIGIPEGLANAGVKLNEELLSVYKKWDEENPFDVGRGWGGEPWAQEEMPVTDELVEEAAKKSTCAVVVIGRTAGEDQDSRNEEGSYLLTQKETDLLCKVRKAFQRMTVLLNVGGIMDMSFVDFVKPDSVLYVWQGGMIGGSGVAQVLTGKINPCGKLPDTIAYHVEDYPSHPNFGGDDRNFYQEDIYVGYRYFETFAKEKVRYPFGFGLSYTSFAISAEDAFGNAQEVSLTVSVTNTGKYAGKEVVQIYAQCPQGMLGKPARVLCAFKKTGMLFPGESEKMTFSIRPYDYASYDETGKASKASCYVLESGEYVFFAGADVRSAAPVFSYVLENPTVVCECSRAMAPVEAMDRMKPIEGPDGFSVGYEAVPLYEDEEAVHQKRMPEEIPYTGDRGILLSDVYEKKNTLEEFVAQLSDLDLSCIIRGEGMGSPRVTPGTAAAFGGVSDRLTDFGIPACCCSDGPSGMRMDCGTTAFSLPNGTLLAATFNTELVEELFTCLGMEMAINHVDCLLGPGMNIHRYPLNGRNFEYFSEDPYLTGKIATGELHGIHKSGATGTIKHFCANNQEKRRHFANGVISERALREIYLKGFEIAVREGNATSVMTTYGPVNGLWTAGSLDLNDVILRGEWGFHGITMTDWWAAVNERGKEPSKTNFAAMARARNDLYMVCSKGSENDDNTMEELQKGKLCRSELQRNAMDICEFILHTNALRRKMGIADKVVLVNAPADHTETVENTEVFTVEDEITVDLSKVNAIGGTSHIFTLETTRPGLFSVTVTASSDLGELAQMPVTLYSMGTAHAIFTWNGTGGMPVGFSTDVYFFSHYSAVRLYFAQTGLKLISMKFVRKE